MATNLSSQALLLVTVTKTETRAVLEALKVSTGVAAKPIYLDGANYQDLGVLQGAQIYLAMSEMGAGGLAGSQETVRKAIAAIQPIAVIMVGIAFGINEQKQAIGEVLVASQVLLYELQRVGESKLIPRGDKAHAAPRLINFLRSAEVYWDETQAKIDFGLILSGEKLVDNLAFREQLLALGPDAIGGEMEAAGLYVACQNAKTDWIMVKAICDWADGNKAHNKAENQALAAKNAAQFIAFALQHVPLFELGAVAATATATASASAQALLPASEPHNPDSAAPPPDDSERLQHTRERIRHYIGQQHFTDMPKLAFVDGLPQAVNEALTAGKSKKQMAQACNDAILNFACSVVGGRFEAGDYASASERKSYLYKALINAMQQSILLSARSLNLEEQQVLAAYQANPPCELEVMSWLSVSVLMRDELAEHLNVELPQGQAALFKDNHQTEFHNEVELGTFVQGSEAGATALARQIAHRALYPAAAVFPQEPNQQQINELRGDLRIKKFVDKQPILTTINKTAGAPSARFIQWLNEELHVGVILINAKEGFFELDEGNWKASLSKLYKTLQPLQPIRAG